MCHKFLRGLSCDYPFGYLLGIGKKKRKEIEVDCYDTWVKLVASDFALLVTKCGVSRSSIGIVSGCVIITWWWW
jgi:hypothetical protein